MPKVMIDFRFFSPTNNKDASKFLRQGKVDLVLCFIL